jgi:prevent-host-death family protein
MQTINVSEFKAKCLALLDEVARNGEGIVILKRGKPVARVVPVSGDGDGFPQDAL